MTDRPIPFSAPMVRAILDGRKTMTRRALKPQPIPEVRSVFCVATQKSTGRPVFNMRGPLGGTICGLPCKHGLLGEIIPPYAVGDRLWVKEALERANGEAVGYPADGTWLPNTHWHWKRAHLPSRFMPRWASRITLEVTGVRVERLQEISEEDAKAEGAEQEAAYTGHHDEAGNPEECGSYRLGFCMLWASIYGPGAWEANPWVAVIEFKRIDAVRAEGR